MINSVQSLFLTVLLTCLFIIAPSHILAADSTAYRIGISAGADFNTHKSDIPIIWDASDCGQYSNGKSLGYHAGINFSYSIWENFLQADFRLVYRSLPVKLSTTTADFQVFNPLKNDYEALSIGHEFNSTMNYLSLEPGILVKPFNDFPFKIRISFDAGNPLFGADYETTDEILSPKIYTFPEKTQKHTTQNGTLEGAGTSYGVTGGVIYEYQLAKNWYFLGELNYRHPLNSALTNNRLNTSWIGLNAGIQYAFGFKEEKIQEKPVIIDTPKIAQPVIVEITPKKIVTADVLPTGLDVMETVVTQTYPILPYVFFDCSSYDIKPLYQRNEKAKFSEQNLPNETLQIYYSMLNIIGLRMTQNPSAELTITGMSDGREEATKNERLSLAEKRANSVSDYLIKFWKIDKDRIAVKVRETPELATSTTYQEGYDENRRVEINSQDFEILKPVIYSRFKEYELLSSEFKLDVISDSLELIADRKITLFASEIPIVVKSMNTADNTLKIIIDDSQKQLITTALTAKKDITIKFEYSSDGKIFENEKHLKIIKTENNFELGRLNLIVFDFDKSEINKMNKDLIRNFVVNSIADNSTVSIVGSTDKLGEHKYNQSLSEERAQSAFRFIKSIKPKAEFKEIIGIGDSKLLYSNAIPEGRFYCRTVLIEVVTPIK